MCSSDLTASNPQSSACVVMIRLGLLVVFALALAACGSDGVRPVPPQGSGDSDMPWNPPQPGEGQGAFGGVFDRQ